MYDKLTELFRPIYTFIMAVGIAQSLACFAAAAAAAYFLRSEERRVGKECRG